MVDSNNVATSNSQAMLPAAGPLSTLIQRHDAPAAAPAGPSSSAGQGSTYAAAPAPGTWRTEASTSQDNTGWGTSSMTGQAQHQSSSSFRGSQSASRPQSGGHQQTNGRGAAHSYQQNTSYTRSNGAYSGSYGYGYSSGGRGGGSSYAYSYSSGAGGRHSSSQQYVSYSSGGQRGYGGRGGSQSFGRGFGGNGSGRGSGGPNAAAQPPMWRKKGPVLLPLPNSALAAAYAKARAASLAAGGPACSVVVMRGLPGAGKSSRAAELVAEAAAQGISCAVHSTDSFFVDAASGSYIFDAAMLSQNHERNRAAFDESLAAGTQMVIVDNTNLQRWQYEPYVKLAWAAGYEVREEVVGEFTEAAVATYAARCIHGVPHEKILIMLDQWQGQ